jgi:hypothetical protein
MLHKNSNLLYSYFHELAMNIVNADSDYMVGYTYGKASTATPWAHFKTKEISEKEFYNYNKLIAKIHDLRLKELGYELD